MRFLRQIEYGLMLTGVLLVSPCLFGQKTSKTKSVEAKIVTWQMPNVYGVADTTRIDTIPQNQPMRNMMNDRSIAWSWDGNLVSASQSKIYFDRSGNGMLSESGTTGDFWQRGGIGTLGGIRPKVDMLFASAYEPYIYTPQDVQFYRTTIAYSDIAYKKGFSTYHEENDLRFSFTGNLSPNTNLGVRMNYLSAPGRYSSQEGKLFNGYLFGSYDGKHYGLHASLCFNNLSNFESGGLENDSLLGGSLKPEDLPTRLKGMSGFSYISGYLDHHYSITTTRDSMDIPLLTFGHVFEVNNARKRYIEKQALQSFYEDTWLNQKSTRDTANVLNIRNTLSVTFNEEFNKLLRFGATVYATNEFQRYQGLEGETDTLIGTTWRNNTWVGGAIYKNNGKWIRFNANGDICLIGYKLGEFQVNGHVDGDWRLGKDTMHVRATAYVKNETPSWFLQHYRSNHFIWENDFGKTYRFFVGGEVSYPSEWIKAKAKVGFENITRYIYFDSKSLPVQKDGNIQVLSAEVRADLTTPWINLENAAIYQLSGDSVLPLPTITLYHNLYYHGWWFKAMYAQIGVDMRYHSAYYAPLLNPATGQFHLQHEKRIGNYPVINLYANFYVKHLKLRFFAQWQHFNYLFMKDTQAYLSMPGYAINPSSFRAGAAWHFWR